MTTSNQASIKTEHSNLTNFFSYLESIGSIVPCFRKHPVTNLPIVDNQGNKELVGFLACDLSSEISDLTDEHIQQLQSSVKQFKNHWSLFSNDSRTFAFGKFSNMTSEEKLSQAQDL